MRIVLATESYYPLIDGGAVAQHQLALALHQRGHQVTILAPSPHRDDCIDEDHGTTIYRFGSIPIPFVKNDHRLAWRPAKKITQVLKSIQPDIVHIHNPFAIGKATLSYCKNHHIPVVATNHWLPENITTFMSKFRFLNSLDVLVSLNWKWIIDFHNQCDFVTSPTQTAIDLMIKKGLRVPCKPVSNGVDQSRFYPNQDTHVLKERFHLPAKPTALYAGRLSGEKQIDVLIRAIPLVLQKIDAHFVIGGNGREKKALQALVTRLGVDEHVTFTGFLEDHEFPLLYNCADVFVMPSICELQSITTLEALSSGLPAVGAHKYALPELIKHTRNGYLFEPGNVQQLAHYLIELFADGTKRQSMGEQSLAIVAPHCLPNAVSAYEAIYLDTKRSCES